ncbi:NAD(P)-dependent dehydrogenase (short-subunit alcohol dehydrogenase family) [Rahnella sp. BIGb0603]|jgi:NAD(P)-dependent dehydrogenase (short-subunit alcohol dehydrogenase family)|uniref:SDR family oxidoreductase n=1 Tax=Rahnella sp. BIGb0603 TaxID=2940612 RepID=UPI002168F811|nr:SDR family oxidoreductase [Rahnella sp. BIGb0603]MCS3421425.1 NAD(P)-dependent dehydrogenase (short-subunit alcohol dehydrogenase family) [Rahnella sp. BIGb0603]
MTDKKVWLITGAGRGLGLNLARAALAAGHIVIATGRDPAKVTRALGQHDSLLILKLDITCFEDAEIAVAVAIQTFGKIDVLVNNAGNFFAGFFEELSQTQVRNQIDTLLFGPMNVTRAVLPEMRSQKQGLIITLSSTAGIGGIAFCSAYCAAKFGVEGWMESLALEVKKFGINSMLVEPGFFRTELLSNDSTQYAELSINDYADDTRATKTAWQGMDGKQGGDPQKLAEALIQLAELEHPPARFAAGADAVETFEAKAKTLNDQANALRELSSSLSLDTD